MHVHKDMYTYIDKYNVFFLQTHINTIYIYTYIYIYMHIYIYLESIYMHIIYILTSTSPRSDLPSLGRRSENSPPRCRSRQIHDPLGRGTQRWVPLGSVGRVGVQLMGGNYIYIRPQTWCTLPGLPIFRGFCWLLVSRRVKQWESSMFFVEYMFHL